MRQCTLDPAQDSIGEAKSGDPLTNATTAIANFCLSEFARLCVVMRHDRSARRSLLKLQQSLTLTDYSKRMSRDDFWPIIAKKFNDKSSRLVQDFSASVPEVDASAKSPCDRTPDIIKSDFQRMMQLFMRRCGNFEAPGKYDAANWPDFLGRTIKLEMR